MSYTRVEVEPSANCPMSAFLVFKNLSEPRPVGRVILYDGSGEGRLYDVTGWSSDTAQPTCQAYAVEVEDSGSGSAVLVYGGDLGLRLRPANEPSDWDLDDPKQFGETHLVLADMNDLS